jgi:DNA-binding transcriptional regulator YiaG
MRLITSVAKTGRRIPVFISTEGKILSYGDGIALLRFRLGWSIAKLAHRLGTTTRMVRQWESDPKKPPDRETLLKLQIIMARHNV